MSAFRVLVQKISETVSHSVQWLVGSPDHWWVVGVALLVILILALSVGRKQPGV